MSKHTKCQNVNTKRAINLLIELLIKEVLKLGKTLFVLSITFFPPKIDKFYIFFIVAQMGTL